MQVLIRFWIKSIRVLASLGEISIAPSLRFIETNYIKIFDLFLNNIYFTETRLEKNFRISSAMRQSMRFSWETKLVLGSFILLPLLILVQDNCSWTLALLACYSRAFAPAVTILSLEDVNIRADTTLKRLITLSEQMHMLLYSLRSLSCSAMQT